jgi:hypothetical protein
VAKVRVPFFTGRRTVMIDYDPTAPLDLPPDVPPPPEAPEVPPAPPPAPPAVGDEQIAPPPATSSGRYAPDPLLGGGGKLRSGRSPMGNLIVLVLLGVGTVIGARALARSKARDRWVVGAA